MKFNAAHFHKNISFPGCVVSNDVPVDGFLRQPDQSFLKMETEKVT